MRSAQEREKNFAGRPPIEAPCTHRQSKRVKSIAEAASVLETPEYVRDAAGRLSSSSLDVTPMSDLRPSPAGSSSSAPRSPDIVPPRTPTFPIDVVGFVRDSASDGGAAYNNGQLAGYRPVIVIWLMDLSTAN